MAAANSVGSAVGYEIPDKSNDQQFTADVTVASDSALMSSAESKRSQRKRPFRKREAAPLSETEVAERALKRLRQRLASNPPSAFNAIMVLNEYQRGLEYELVEHAGPTHSPSFTIHLNIDGQMFEGVSSSKKKAKLIAAESAVKALFYDIEPKPDVIASAPVSAASGTTPSKMETTETEAQGTNPTVVLNQLRPGTTYESVATDAATEVAATTEVTYRMSCLVDGENFEGAGTSKKMAKARAAEAALLKVFSIKCTETGGWPMYMGDRSQLKATKQSAGKAGTPAGPAVALPQLQVTLPDGKNPMILINELYHGTEFTAEPSPESIGVYVAKATIEDREFQGQGTSKKMARMAAAIGAINYLHKSGLLNVRLSEKAIRKQTSSWPKPRAHFSQDGTTGAQGRGRGGRGRGRGRGKPSYSSVKQGFSSDSSAWVAGGVLKAGDFLGLRGAQSRQDTTAQYGDETDYVAESIKYANRYNSGDAAYSTDCNVGYGSYPGYGTEIQSATMQQAYQAATSKLSDDKKVSTAATGYTSYGSYGAYGSTTSQPSASGSTAKSGAARGGRGRGAGSAFGGVTSHTGFGQVYGNVPSAKSVPGLAGTGYVVSTEPAAVAQYTTGQEAYQGFEYAAAEYHQGYTAGYSVAGSVPTGDLYGTAQVPYNVSTDQYYGQY